jgi:hypothetical protein
MAEQQLTDHARNVRWAEMIRRHWRDKGVAVDIRLEVVGTDTCLRSNLVRGLQPQADEEVSDASAS